MSPVAPSRSPAAALRLARHAWRLQHRDAERSIALAERALAAAVAAGDDAAQAQARLARGFHLMRYAAPAQAQQELARARRLFDAAGDAAGAILASTGIARSIWIQGRYRESLELVLPLRDGALRLLRHEERGIVLNAIAGCYSSLGDSEQAFAYMYQALRESSPARGQGFDVVLYCNLAHELYQLGDYHEALRYLEEGVARCTRLANARLMCVLLTNRIICLTDLGRARDALPDIRAVLQLPADGRGAKGAAFEVMALAALRAADLALGERLVEDAIATLGADAVPDEQVGLVVAQAECLRRRGDLDGAALQLERSRALCADGTTEGLSLRVRCLFFEMLADVEQALGHADAALEALRAWQSLHIERAQLASRARHQAATLQTELLRLQHELLETDARRRATERARAELEAINLQLSRKVTEVQELQAALKQQATRDFLTGLFNRRHLSDVLPAMLALAARDRQPLSVAIVDLDRFKAVNDHHGHDAGDRLLAAFGELVLQRCRRSDVACRYGGEEFCLVMPRTDAAAARRKLATLLRSWRRTVFELDHARLAGCTFSAGVADTRMPAATPDALLKAADAALLDAKRLGRSRIVVAGPDPQASVAAL